MVGFGEIERPGYARRSIDFANALAVLFGRRVELLTERMIGDPQFREAIERTRRWVGEREGERAAS